jgi:hypothetical protein
MEASIANCNALSHNLAEDSEEDHVWYQVRHYPSQELAVVLPE